MSQRPEQSPPLTRRSLLAAAAATPLALAACGAPGGNGKARSQPASSVPAKPKSAQVLNILDVAGNLQLTQGMIDNFVKAHPDIVSRVTATKATAPELAGKIKAQQDAGQVSIHLILTGTDGLAAGIAQDLWVKMTPDYDDRLPDLTKIYQDPAAKMQQLAQGHGVELVYYPSGPLFEYNPQVVTHPPKTSDDLLAWAKAHPGKFQYAVPENSGPGRTLLMGLPYILGDSDPRDPDKGWDKTWAFLSELGKYITYYPSGTSETMKNLASGAVSMIASTTGWDINPRALGTVPKGMKVAALDGFHWVTDAQYAVVPKGVSADSLSAILNLIKFMLTPKQQAIAYDNGYFYPGPAVKGVSLSMAPSASQQVIKDYGRSEYSKLIADHPKETSLPATQQVAAFDKWDRTIAGTKAKKK
jgi:putative spermidine/putrescine transport system substrate-binding protein